MKFPVFQVLFFPSKKTEVFIFWFNI